MPESQNATLSIVGGKGAAGVAERIIAEMPPHDCYLEPFAGSATIYRRKRACRHAILIERDHDTAVALKRMLEARRPVISDEEVLTVYEGDCREILRSWTPPAKTLIYFDPPYLMSTRSSPRNYYRHELATEDEHRALLQWARALAAVGGAMVMISGYRSALYDELLWSWRRIDFPAMTRRHVALESLWMSFPESRDRHDSRFAGENFRERERIKRKAARWRARFAVMSFAERAAIRVALDAADRGD